MAAQSCSSPSAYLTARTRHLPPIGRPQQTLRTADYGRPLLLTPLANGLYERHNELDCVLSKTGRSATTATETHWGNVRGCRLDTEPVSLAY